MHLAAQSRARALFRSPDTWISPDKMKSITTAVYGACDGLDRATDRIISNVAGCNRVMTMDALRAKLRCPDGRDTGATCLSDGQLATVETFNTPFSPWVPHIGGPERLSETCRFSTRFNISERPRTVSRTVKVPDQPGRDSIRGSVWHRAIRDHSGCDRGSAGLRPGQVGNTHHGGLGDPGTRTVSTCRSS